MHPDHVIYVHGLFMNGLESALLRRRLSRQYGLATHTFTYPTRSLSARDIAGRLHAFASRIVDCARPARLHFIAHSLGGIVLCNLLEQSRDLPAGRVVLLGSPVVACRTAHAIVHRGPLMRGLVGVTVAEELAVSRERRWSPDRPLAVVAGSRSVGLGRFFARFDEPNDGTVAVGETMLPGAAARVVLPVSHMGMLFSGEVAARCGQFLTTGELSRADPYAIS